MVNKDKKKIAFVVQRYGLEVSGGAEYHCRLLAEHLSQYLYVDVITTCAVDYISWENYYKPGVEILNSVRVVRFPVDYLRKRWIFGGLSKIIYNFPHTRVIEELWMRAQGPYSSKLFEYIQNSRNNYSCFIFITYQYCTTYFGIKYVRDRSILVPTAEDTPQLRLKIFKDVFNAPQRIIYNTPEEKKLINQLFKNEHIKSDVIGIGISLPGKIEPENFRNKYNIKDRFILYIGRITVDKGCNELLEFFIKYNKDCKENLKLVLIGKAYMKIPGHKDIIHLGFLPEEDKFSALKSTELLVLPSRYESLSMVLLEAWCMGKPVLVNSECAVTKGQVERSKGGLVYADYHDFKEKLNMLINNKRMSEELGKNGYNYYYRNYSWQDIERKYLEIISNCD